MKDPKILKLKLPEVMRKALTLPPFGRLTVSKEKLIYLAIDDEYVHGLFPLLGGGEIKKPNYFGDRFTGAHITVFYPEEKASIEEKEFGKEHFFKIKDIVMVEIGARNYYALMVDCPSLIELRRANNLPDMLNFKNYSVEFHITIGVSDR